MALYHPANAVFLALYATLGSPDTNDSLPDWHHWPVRHSYSLLKPKGFALVPGLVYNPLQNQAYLASTGITPSEATHICIDEISLENCLMVYDNEGSEGDSSVYAQLINQLCALQAHSSKEYLHLHIDIDGLLIVAFKEGKLQLANQFSFKAREDILYYVASCAHSCGIDLENDLFTYSGYLRPKSALKSLLKKYIGHLKPLSVSDTLNFDVAINPLHRIYYADIFVLPLCAL